MDESELVELRNEFELAAAVTVRLDMGLTQRDCIQHGSSKRDRAVLVVRFEPRLVQRYQLSSQLCASQRFMSSDSS